MINYEELKTAITDISNICRMTDCDKCPMMNNEYDCILCERTPNNWIDEIPERSFKQFAARGAHLVEEGYINE